MPLKEQIKKEHGRKQKIGQDNIDTHHNQGMGSIYGNSNAVERTDLDFRYVLRCE